MTDEKKLFEKIAAEIQKQFESIGDEKVKKAVEGAFEAYQKVYETKSEKEVTALKKQIEDLNTQFESLNNEQVKQLANQLTSIEEKFESYEETIKELGKKITSGMAGQSGAEAGEFAKGIEEYLSAKLPHEDGKVIFEAMEGLSFASLGNVNDIDTKEKASAKGLAVFSTKSMFAAIDHTNANSTTGQAIARDMDTMGFRNIPPILNDHVADIFTTPPLAKKAWMTLRIFYELTDGVDIKVEGTGTFAKSSIKLKSQDFKVFTYGTQYRISVEEYDDVPEITAELNRVVPDRMMNDLDAKILTDGGDNGAAPWGAFSPNVTSPNVTAFNAYLYAGSNPKADEADLVAKMKLQARSQNYRVNATLAHDNFYDNYEGKRDDNGNSLSDRRVQFSPQGEIIGIAGLVTRKSRIMNETAVFVCSTPSQVLGIRENVMMQVGLNGDDFATHNMSTKWWGRFAYGAKDALANVYSADYLADIAILKMNAATALAYTNSVAVGTAGFDQANITISLLATAGAVSLVDANETAYQVAIEAEAGIADLPALQAVIDAVNAA